jgi:S-adenosylmethionine/arginine decarboxylase-like enzyme
MEAKIYGFRGWVTETDPDRLAIALEGLLHSAGFTVLNYVAHHFKPAGFTALWLLGESHLAAHTWPEEGRTYIELSSCNEQMQVEFIRLINLPNSPVKKATVPQVQAGAIEWE